MSNQVIKLQQRTETIKNEQTRQRWDLFHRAIALAKQTNISELDHDVDADVCRILQFESLTP